jgi:signal transduction histidine kinase
MFKKSPQKKNKRSHQVCSKQRNGYPRRRYWPVAVTLVVAFASIAFATWGQLYTTRDSAERAQAYADLLSKAARLEAELARELAKQVSGLAWNQKSSEVALAADALQQQAAAISDDAIAFLQVKSTADSPLIALWVGEEQANIGGSLRDVTEKMVKAARERKPVSAPRRVPHMQNGMGWVFAIDSALNSSAVALARQIIVKETAASLGNVSRIALIAIAALIAISGIAYFALVKPMAIELGDQEIRLRLERDKALESARAKREFLAVMSHELRTPLNGVLGVASILLGKRMEASERELVSMLKNSGEDLLRVLNDILEVAQLEAGDYTPTERAFQLTALFADVSRLILPRAEEKGLNFEFVEATTLPQEVYGDPAAIRKILLNLVDNAVKFTDEGGVTVEITNRPATGGTVVDDTAADAAVARLRITVRDSGCGVSADNKTKIFEQFSQLSGYQNRKHDGLGVGLAIARDLARSLGGDLTVESEEGKGSAFHLDINLVVSDAAAVGLDAEAEEAVDILVVVENERARLAVGSVFTAQGLTVATASSGAEAIKTVAAENAALLLILMDNQEDGLALARRWRAREVCSGVSGGGVKTRIITAGTAANHAQSKEVEAAWHAAGANAVLSRPIDRDDLLYKACELLTDHCNEQNNEPAAA